MQAIVYEGPNKLTVKDLPMPQLPEGWAMVKVSHAGICGTDLHIYEGSHPRAKAPLVMGHEFSGILESDGVDGIPKGCQDLVMMETDPARAKLARDMGFEVQNPTQVGDMGEYCKSRTGGDGYDWVFDCAGVQPVADVLLDAVKVKGHILVVASYSKPAAMPYFKGMAKECDIQFTRVYRLKDFALAAKIVGADPNYEKVITHVLPAAEAQKGFDLLTTKGTGTVKVMFSFD